MCFHHCTVPSIKECTQVHISIRRYDADLSFIADVYQRIEASIAKGDFVNHQRVSNKPDNEQSQVTMTVQKQ